MLQQDDIIRSKSTRLRYNLQFIIVKNNRMTSNESNYFVLAVLFFVVIAVGIFTLWNLGAFNVGNSEYIGGGYATGFDRIGHPYEVYYCNKSFTASFINQYSNQIDIKSVSAFEYISGEDCMQERDGSLFSPQSIYPKSAYNISASCPSKTDGESFKIALTVYYSESTGGTEKDYADTGFIFYHGSC